MSDVDDLRARIEARVAERRRHPNGPVQPATGHTGPSAVAGDTSASTQPLAAVPTTVPAPDGTDTVTDPVTDTVRIPKVTPARSSRHGPSRRPRRSPMSSFVLRLVSLVVIACLLTLGLRTWVVEPFWIPSQSMEPTLHGCPGCDEDRLLVNKLVYRFHPPHRGDVVVFSRPANFAAGEKDLIKRVIGLPGDVVSGHGGQVWIGNRPLTEPYVNAVCHGTADFAPVTVPKGDVFVMGDNRCDSSDSRIFGPIKESSIVGRAFIVFWPLGRIHWL